MVDTSNISYERKMFHYPGTKPGVRRRQTEVTPTVSTTPPINKTPFVDNKQPTVYRPSGSSKRPSQENEHHPVSTRRPTNNNYNEPQITSTRSRPQEEFEWITEQPLSIQRYSDATLDPLPSINTPSPPLKEYQPREPLPNDSWKTTPRSPSTRRPQDTRPETDLKPTGYKGRPSRKSSLTMDDRSIYGYSTIHDVGHSYRDVGIASERVSVQDETLPTAV
uniref:Uncharacterized protein n=1 Tax=Timema cristinae TaxID=61476 RepID=A0A7R9CUY3_TIMCR|nr:unnamed protein product [Timema cristinae]